MLHVATLAWIQALVLAPAWFIVALALVTRGRSWAAAVETLLVFALVALPPALVLLGFATPGGSMEERSQFDRRHGAIVATYIGIALAFIPVAAGLVWCLRSPRR